MKLSKYEESPWKAVNQLSDKYERYAHEITKLTLNGVIHILGGTLKKAHEDAPLIFKGRIMYNPKDGKPIKAKDWKKLEEVVAKYLNIEKRVLQEGMTSDSYFLGTLINRLESETARRNQDLKKYNLENPNWSAYGYTDFDRDIIRMSEQNAGIYLQGVNDRMRSKIQSILIEGTKSKKAGYKVFQDLWDSEVDLNRDWDRVIRTETAYSTNNGLLISQLRTSEEEHIFMKGISAPDACPHCLRLISEKVVVLLEGFPEGGSDKITIDKKEYSVIWPGKSNYGRKSADYWTCAPLHPYCRCSWNEWFVEIEEAEIKISDRSRKWGEAMEEVKARGIEEEDDRFMIEVDKLFRQKLEGTVKSRNCKLAIILK